MTRWTVLVLLVYLSAVVRGGENHHYDHNDDHNNDHHDDYHDDHQDDHHDDHHEEEDQHYQDHHDEYHSDHHEDKFFKHRDRHGKCIQINSTGTTLKELNSFSPLYTHAVSVCNSKHGSHGYTESHEYSGPHEYFGSHEQYYSSYEHHGSRGFQGKRASLDSACVAYTKTNTPNNDLVEMIKIYTNGTLLRVAGVQTCVRPGAFVMAGPCGTSFIYVLAVLRPGTYIIYRSNHQGSCIYDPKNAHVSVVSNQKRPLYKVINQGIALAQRMLPGIKFLVLPRKNIAKCLCKKTRLYNV